jgi:hypothetical protein
LNEHPKAGIVGPRIIMPDGSIYNSAKLFPTLTDKLMKLPRIFLGTKGGEPGLVSGFSL